MTITGLLMFIQDNTVLSTAILGLLGFIGNVAYKRRTAINVFVRRKKLEFFPIKYNVALSLDFKEGLNSGLYYREITKRLKDIISANNLVDVIHINDFSDIKKFSSSEEAEEFKIRKNIDLIIWGGFTEDGLKMGGELINKLDLRFTYGYLSDREKKIKNMIEMDISSKLAIKNYWQIVDSNSSLDTEILSTNLFDVSTYILALSLKFSGRIGTSTKIFESLFESLKTRNDTFIKQVIPHVLNCYEILINDYGLSSKKDMLKIGVDYCQRYLKIEPDDFFALTNLAAFQCFLGQESESELNVDRLLKLYPKRPATELNVAYFRILRKNYSNAYKHYFNLSQFTYIDFNTQLVVDFLYAQYDLRKDPAFLYGIGIVSFYHGDKEIAYQVFEKYLAISNENICKNMYRTAKRLSIRD